MHINTILSLEALMTNALVKRKSSARFKYFDCLIRARHGAVRDLVCRAETAGRVSDEYY